MIDDNEWEFGEHTECPVCGTDCYALWQKANKESELNKMLKWAIEEIKEHNSEYNYRTPAAKIKEAELLVYGSIY